MKKFMFLFTVLGCLVLSFGALAEDIVPDGYCRVDNFGCYVTDDENHSSYLMFWSEEARQVIMGNLSAPYELVVSMPGADAVVDNNLFPLFVPTAPAESSDPVVPEGPTATATSTATATAEPTVMATATATSTAAATAEPMATATATSTATATAEPMATATATSTATATAEPTATVTFTATATPITCGLNDFVASYCIVHQLGNECSKKNLPIAWFQSEADDPSCWYETDNMINKFCQSPETYVDLYNWALLPGPYVHGCGG